jgi:hypothetical protein
MKYLALISLICLISGAAAQALFTGEGYGRAQLAFFNGPSTSSFDPSVDKYWNSYIHNSGGVNSTAFSTTMDIWRNNFPQSFDTPIQIQKSSFISGVATQDYSKNDYDSLMLRRGIFSNLNLNDTWMYTPVYTPSNTLRTSFNFQNTGSDSSSAGDSSGQIISQSVLASFATS